MTTIEIRGHPGMGPDVAGSALVASDNFSARYDLDRKAGVFSRPSHALYGESYVGKILILNAAKGGVATSWMLYNMAAEAPRSETPQFDRSLWAIAVKFVASVIPDDNPTSRGCTVASDGAIGSMRWLILG